MPYTQARIKDRLQSVFAAQQAEVLAQVISDAYTDLVKTGDFNELKAIVRDIAEAQRDFAKAQRQSEGRLTRLEATFADLAEAQRQSEKRLSQVEQAMVALTEAQRRTEEELHALVEDHRETRRQLGGLAMTVGYGLENQAYKSLPALLQRDFGITVPGRLKRQYVQDNRGRTFEVNILGRGLKDGEEIVILGESQSQLSQNDVDAFIAKRYHPLREILGDPVFLVMVTHMTRGPDVAGYAQAQDIALYYSYDL